MSECEVDQFHLRQFGPKMMVVIAATVLSAIKKWSNCLSAPRIMTTSRKYLVKMGLVRHEIICLQGDY